MSLLKAMTTIGGLTGLSRIAGFARDIMMAGILGAGPIADAFFVALKLPNFFRRVTAEGAFSVSFIPLYTKTLENEGRAAADDFASNVFVIKALYLSVFVVLAVLAMPFIIMGIAPGFETGGDRYDLALEMSRITFPYLLFISLSALLGGVLNALGRFGPFAFAPVIFNLCLIIALALDHMFESAGHALAYGVLAAGIGQMAYLFFCARGQGFFLKIAAPHYDHKIKKVLTLMGPGIVGAGVIHINLFADLIMASFLGEGSISYLYYADRLNQLPLGIVGIAIGTALLPMLSSALAKGEGDKARHLFNRALEYSLLLALPAAAALIVIPAPIIQVLFERGAFSAADSAQTSFVLALYAIGLPSYIMIKVFSTAHWSREDTLTPVKIAVKATLLNIILSLAFIQIIGVAGIALGTGLTGWLQVYLHMRSLKTHSAAQFDERFKRVFIRLVFSTLVMSAVLLFAMKLGHGAFDETIFIQILALAGLIFTGIFTYAACVLATGAIKIQDIKGYVTQSTQSTRRD